MKALFYLQSLSSGGAERVTSILANHWAQRGWAVTVVTVAGKDLDFYRLDSHIHRIALNMAIQSRHLGQAVVNNIRRIRALHQILRREKPDVAIAMMATANVTLALAGRFAGVSVVGSERTYPPALPLGYFWERARRWAYPMLAGLVVQTGGGAAWLREHAPAQRIAIIPNPVQYPLVPHPPQRSPSEVISSLQGRHILLAVGRLGEEKRFDRLLIAFAELADHHPDWSLVILGQGALHQALTEQASSLGIRNRVALPGAFGNVGEWYETADLYVLTSRFEGFPNTLLEALAHGVPSVAVDCATGPREILRHEVDGLLVPQDNHHALVDGLARLMDDKLLRQQYAARAIEVRERFSMEKIAGTWEKLFLEIS